MAEAGFKYWWVLVAMMWVPTVHAQSGVEYGTLVGQSEVNAASEQIVAETLPEKRKTKSRMLFWIVLVISLLFVVGSATALNAMGGRQSAVRRHDNNRGDGGQGKAGSGN